MVTKRKTPRRARRNTPARRAAPRRRAKSGITYIPSAMATVGLVAANAENIKQFYKAVTDSGNHPEQAIDRIIQGNEWVVRRAKAFVSANNIASSALAMGAGYVGGELVKKYAPGMIKRPLGKIAKKIPKVI